MYNIAQDPIMLLQSSYDRIEIKKLYIDIAEDLIAGILLSQIILLNLPTSEDSMEFRVERDNELWIAKDRSDWWNECRITPKQFDRAIKILEEKSLVQKKLFKLNGTPMVHIKLNADQLIQCISNLSKTENL